MHCHCGTNNRAPRWTFTDPCKPEVRPGAREESASPAWLAAPAMNARDTTKVNIWRLDTGCGPTLCRNCHSHNTSGKRHNNTRVEPLAGNCTTSSTRQREQVWHDSSLKIYKGSMFCSCPFAVNMDNVPYRHLIEQLVVLRIYVALAVFQPCRDLEAGDNQSLKFKWRDRESNPGPLAPQAKSLTTWPPPLPLIEQFKLTLQIYCQYVVGQNLSNSKEFPTLPQC